MKMNAMFLSQLDSEVERSKRALLEFPEDQYEWTPHEKSMTFGYLSEMVGHDAIVDCDDGDAR